VCHFFTHPFVTALPRTGSGKRCRSIVAALLRSLQGFREEKLMVRRRGGRKRALWEHGRLELPHAINQR